MDADNRCVQNKKSSVKLQSLPSEQRNGYNRKNFFFEQQSRKNEAIMPI